MKIYDMNADQILKHSKLSQTNSNYSLPSFKPKKNEPETKPPTPVTKFFDLLKRDFNHLNNHSYEKWKKIIITAEPYDDLRLVDDGILLRLLFIMPARRKQGLGALAIRCIKEASDESGAAIIAFSNPINFTHKFTTEEALMTSIRGGYMRYEYLYNEEKQQRQNYRILEAGCQQMNLEEPNDDGFCDRFSTFCYLPKSFNEDLKKKVIEPRLVKAE
tara:strand:- start:157 stop:807 length:651 start_codon:yes stop_codon:yes gene_type:complete